jgi:hypothetical protein
VSTGKLTFRKFLLPHSLGLPKRSSIIQRMHIVNLSETSVTICNSARSLVPVNVISSTVPYCMK